MWKSEYYWFFHGLVTDHMLWYRISFWTRPNRTSSNWTLVNPRCNHYRSSVSFYLSSICIYSPTPTGYLYTACLGTSKAACESIWISEILCSHEESQLYKFYLETYTLLLGMGQQLLLYPFLFQQTLIFEEVCWYFSIILLSESSVLSSARWKHISVFLSH